MSRNQEGAGRNQEGANTRHRETDRGKQETQGKRESLGNTKENKWGHGQAVTLGGVYIVQQMYTWWIYYR